jgi:hypothetical protein
MARLCLSHLWPVCVYHVCGPSVSITFVARLCLSHFSILSYKHPPFQPTHPARPHGIPGTDSYPSHGPGLAPKPSHGTTSAINNQLKHIVVVNSVVWLHILLGPSYTTLYFIRLY